MMGYFVFFFFFYSKLLLGIFTWMLKHAGDECGWLTAANEDPQHTAYDHNMFAHFLVIHFDRFMFLNEFYLLWNQLDFIVVLLCTRYFYASLLFWQTSINQIKQTNQATDQKLKKKMSQNKWPFCQYCLAVYFRLNTSIAIALGQIFKWIVSRSSKFWFHVYCLLFVFYLLFVARPSVDVCS